MLKIRILTTPKQYLSVIPLFNLDHQIRLQHISTGICRPGRSRDLGGGAIFFSDLEICMSRTNILRIGKPCTLLGRFGSMLPRIVFLKNCVIWCIFVYILIRFYQRFIKITIFLCIFLYLHACYGVCSSWNFF